ncbi:helix-turn-helix domain-containing protein [Herbaspirillum sp. RTI4]|uniref:GlxA family transcriptional regulator n=1 Tax=Herbaspirillum sp. RTI4 TaxID=3048640 RepID=UPI002AB4C659|nr:helix-turn-helix domain-containing protein [Herbaspirillum sp. RTI4]MDY7580033.1 helix-turn-helix domain-containing protein [Herbaspirillum sp. RTI4]MEA9982984.1 helix-turn-helix domain-containing protein [Herbaspirillum sp. RTI4]
MTKRIALLAFDGISTFHLSIPYAVFGENRQDIGIPAYTISLCAAESGVLRTSMGLEIQIPDGLAALTEADIIIIPSWKDIDSLPPPHLTAALKEAHRRGARIVGLCLGAFLVAEAGLLAGRSATTHWAWAPVFAKRFPSVILDPQVLYIDHGDVVTSAGTAAGLDCCLHLLRQELGAELASRIARRLVIPPHRQGNQAQYVEPSSLANTGADRLAGTLEWAQGMLGEPLDVAMLANHAAMSRRTFTRHFRQATGMGIVQWLTVQRLFAAQRLLETSNASIEHIASATGFRTALSLRLAFAKSLDTTPSQYRREFGGQ